MFRELPTKASTNMVAPPLTPKLAPWMHRLVERREVAVSWIERHGSPLHVLEGSEFRRNVADLKKPFQERNTPGGLFFARKANKLPWFVSLAAEEGIGVDTASLNEVEETLALGVPAEQIVITAIGKEHKLVSRAIESGCLLVVDNFDELKLIESLAKSFGKEARIGLRFSGFRLAKRTIFSRFGFPISESTAIIDRLDQSVKLEILHAHIDRYDVEERASAARQLMNVCTYAASVGKGPAGIDLGGGILMRYLDSSQQWAAFISNLINSVKGDQAPITYDGDGFGFYKEGDHVAGEAELYPAWNTMSKERFVEAILDHEDNGVPLHRELKERKLKLYFEPGRALLDNTGVTLSRVAFRKRDTRGDLLIGMAMNRMNLRPFRAEFCSDPILLSNERSESARELDCSPEEGAFMVGCLCSESDLIYKRRLKLVPFPNAEDIYLFANTAGYLAHHLEVGTHGDPLPGNILVDPDDWRVIDQMR